MGMEFSEYQRQAMATNRAAASGPTMDPARELEVYLLGLAGEAGSVASEYKKHLRDGSAHARWLPRMSEELGDVLWYVAAIAEQVGLALEDIAASNLVKTRARWLTSPVMPLDSGFSEAERLPRAGVYEFRATVRDGRPAVALWFDKAQRGDQLTDAAAQADGYRFHDIFHLSYAALLGWSPVTRALLDCKRRSDRAVDENEDGGRAVVIEEGVAALVFAYAAQHDYLDTVTRLDQRLLETIIMLTSVTEARVRTSGDWEQAILAGFACFRQLLAHDGGSVLFDADAGTLDFRPFTS